MASSDDERVFSMGRLKRALLPCPVCMESSGMGLKILECHHSMCEGCLGRLIDGKSIIHCPECRHPMIVPDQGIDGFQNNFIAERIKDFANSCEPKTDEAATTVSETSKCGSCKLEIERVWHLCVLCGYLCNSCTWKHRDDKTLRRHTIFIPSRSSDSGRVKSGFCTTHVLCRLEFFCETCRVAVCKLCKEFHHNSPGHSVRNVREVAQNSLDEMAGLLKAVTDRQSLVFEVLQKVRQEEERVITESANRTKEIEAFIRECQGILKKRGMELKGSLDHQSMQLSKCIMYSREKAEDLLAKIHNSLKCVDKIAREQDPLSVIRAVEALKPALQAIADMRPDIDVVHEDVFLSVTARDLPFDVATFKHMVSLLGKTQDES